MSHQVLKELIDLVEFMLKSNQSDFHIDFHRVSLVCIFLEMPLKAIYFNDMVQIINKGTIQSTKH